MASVQHADDTHLHGDQQSHIQHDERTADELQQNRPQPLPAVKTATENAFEQRSSSGSIEDSPTGAFDTSASGTAPYSLQDRMASNSILGSIGSSGRNVVSQSRRFSWSLSSSQASAQLKGITNILGSIASHQSHHNKHKEPVTGGAVDAFSATASASDGVPKIHASSMTKGTLSNDNQTQSSAESGSGPRRNKLLSSPSSSFRETIDKVMHPSQSTTPPHSDLNASRGPTPSQSHDQEMSRMLFRREGSRNSGMSVDSAEAQALGLIQAQRPAAGRRSRRGSKQSEKQSEPPAAPVDIDDMHGVTGAINEIRKSSSTDRRMNFVICNADSDGSDDGNSHDKSPIMTMHASPTATQNQSPFDEYNSSSKTNQSDQRSMSSSFVTPSTSISSTLGGTAISAVDTTNSAGTTVSPSILSRRSSRDTTSSKSRHRKRNSISEGVKALLTAIRPHPRNKVRPPTVQIEGVSLTSLMLAEEQSDHVIRFTSGFPSTYKTAIEHHNIHLKDVRVSEMTQSIRGTLAIDTSTMNLPSRLSDMHVIVGVNYCFNNMSGSKEFWGSTDEGSIQLDKTQFKPHLIIQFKFPLYTCFIKDVYGMLRQSKVDTTPINFFVESGMTIMVDVFRDVSGTGVTSEESNPLTTTTTTADIGSSFKSGNQGDGTHSSHAGGSASGGHKSTGSISSISSLPVSSTSHKSSLSPTQMPTLRETSGSQTNPTTASEKPTTGNLPSVTLNAPTPTPKSSSNQSVTTSTAPDEQIATNQQHLSVGGELVIPPSDTEQSMSSTGTDPSQECLLASADFVVRFELQRLPPKDPPPE